MQLLESEWIFITDIIYKFNTIKDFDEARRELLDMIRLLIRCDKATFFLTDMKQKNSIGNPVGSDYPEELMQEYIDLQMHQDYARWLFATTQGHTYRTAEWFPPGEREKEPYYRSYYKKCNIHYAGLLTLAHNDKFVGIICLYRDKTWPDFSDHDMFILDILEKHISKRVYDELYGKNVDTIKVSDIIGQKLEVIAARCNLTKREREIVGLLVSGKSTDDICKQLVIAPGTLKTHISNVYKKMNIGKRSELLKMFSE
ncbi:MAG: helix-turn-helix transcriptional regulator [Bacillota bacterium]|nr:helix-turn-helix transcriptional regulator [Bacillota bacterium]